MFKNYQELQKEIKTNILNHGWNADDCVFEYTEQNDFLPGDATGIINFIWTLDDDKYRGKFFNQDAYDLCNKYKNYTLRGVIYWAFIDTMKEVVRDYANKIISEM